MFFFLTVARYSTKSLEVGCTACHADSPLPLWLTGGYIRGPKVVSYEQAQAQDQKGLLKKSAQRYAAPTSKIKDIEKSLMRRRRKMSQWRTVGMDVELNQAEEFFGRIYRDFHT